MVINVKKKKAKFYDAKNRKTVINLAEVKILDISEREIGLDTQDVTYTLTCKKEQKDKWIIMF